MRELQPGPIPVIKHMSMNSHLGTPYCMQPRVQPNNISMFSPVRDALHTPPPEAGAGRGAEAPLGHLPPGTNITKPPTWDKYH